MRFSMSAPRRLGNSAVSVLKPSANSLRSALTTCKKPGIVGSASSICGRTRHGTRHRVRTRHPSNLSATPSQHATTFVPKISGAVTTRSRVGRQPPRSADMAARTVQVSLRDDQFNHIERQAPLLFPTQLCTNSRRRLSNSSCPTDSLDHDLQPRCSCKDPVARLRQQSIFFLRKRGLSRSEVTVDHLRKRYGGLSCVEVFHW